MAKATATAPPDFTQLAEQRAYLMKIARLELRDEHLAEDMVSDVLTQAYERRDSFRGDSSLRTWLTTILKNRIVDFLRKQWREQPLELAVDDDGEGFEPLFDAAGHWAQAPSQTPNPEQLCAQDAFLGAVRMCVEKLPQRIAQVFVLREVFGSDTKELCKDLGLTASNVWVQLYRARVMLRMCLEKSGFAPEGASA
ncbi:MAG TPA: sigma-70 family RNA polymerase sigma factor [Xanthomonadaceae bacterium]|jgi:RNA polymerase sigma-70 factor (ECF subfamily)